MPNHVTSKIRVFGKGADVAALIEKVQGTDNTFDFNRVLPMPSELREVKSGGCTIDGVHVKEWREVKGQPVRITPERLRLMLKRYGATNWFDWACLHWGTKWNSYGATAWLIVSKGAPTDTVTAKIEITTAWDSPKPVLDKLAKLFPTLDFHVSVGGEIDDPYSYGWSGRAGRVAS